MLITLWLKLRLPVLHLAALWVCLAIPLPTLNAQTESAGSPASQAQSADSPLARDQESVAERFARLEELLLRSSELESVENPTRSALLQQAARLGKEAQLADLLAEAAKNLQSGQFTEAIERQKASRTYLEQLLKLLQSENREKRVREDREQVRRWIEETDRLLRLQSSLRGRTEGGQEAAQAASDQSKLSDKAQEIASDLGGDSEDSNQEANDTDPTDQPDSEANQDSSESSDGQAQPTKPGEDQDSNSAAESDQPSNSSESGQSDPSATEDPQSGDKEEDKGDENLADDSDAPEEDSPQKKQPSDGDSNQSESQSEAGKPSSNAENQQDSSQPSDSNDSSQPTQDSQQGQQGQQNEQPQTPMQRAKQKIQQAQQKMQDAQQALEQAEDDPEKREEAIEDQRQAESELRDAIEELEQILRQLREEEIERSLASLEDRLRLMLDLQNKVLSETERLREISGDGKPNRQVEIRANNLSVEEKKILAEGERAFLLLKEEGSSAAFPEAVKQVNQDIALVVERLESGDIGDFTLLTEQEIVTALEELVQALSRIRKENEEKKQQQQQPGMQQQMQPDEQPLVDQLAELRLIRTLQSRINKRTQNMADMLNDPSDILGQVEDSDILDALDDLSERQAKIKAVTRNIATQQGQP